MARQLGARAMFAERNEDDVLIYKRGFEFNDDDRILLMEDIVTTGKSFRETVEALKAHPDCAKPLGPNRGRGVAAGAVARLVVPQVSILAYVAEIGGDRIDPANFDADQIGQNPFWCPDADAAARWETLVDDARKAGSSLGAVVECVATGVPAGWGAPLYAKLDSELAAAMIRPERNADTESDGSEPWAKI
mgnify:CR=1 FL=1